MNQLLFIHGQSYSANFAHVVGPSSGFFLVVKDFGQYVENLRYVTLAVLTEVLNLSNWVKGQAVFCV